MIRFLSKMCAILFAAKRFSGAKWHEFDPGFQTTREIQAEIVGETPEKPAAIYCLEVTMGSCG
jgi:hypothetical protein